MEIIVPRNKSIWRLLGAVKLPQGPVRWSTCLLRAPVQTGTLLFNTLTLELVYLSREELKEPLDDSLRQRLTAHWFLVSEDLDEHRTVRELRQTLRLMQGPAQRIRMFTILPTTACNARCAYCFEKDWTPLTMAEETADRTADYILEQAGGGRILLIWFGGEPLVNLRAIDRISQRLQEAGAAYTAGMFTNGFLLNRALVLRARELWHLGAATITVDGAEAVYNRTKNYVYPGVNAFRTVMENIHSLAEAGIEARLRMHLGPDNLAEVSELTDFLIREFRGQPNVTVYPMPLYEEPDNPETWRTEAERDRIYGACLELRTRLEEARLLRRTALCKTPVLYRCMADRGDSVTVLPDGKLGLCEHYNRDHFIGDIRSEGLDGEMIRQFTLLREEIPACGDCPLYPVCLRLQNCPCEICHRQRRDDLIDQQQQAMRLEWEAYNQRKRQQA